MGFLALLGGATFFGVLAMSGKSEKDVLANTAAVSSSSPPVRATLAAKATAHPIASRVPTPPAPDLDNAGPEPEIPDPVSSSEDARQLGALPRKPVTPSTRVVKQGELCAPSGVRARTAGGRMMICEPSGSDNRNRWKPA
jgi:hypothetical protein